MLESNKVILFDTFRAYIVERYFLFRRGYRRLFIFLPVVACSHLAPLFLYVSCLMGEGAHSVRVDKTSHATIIIKQEIKQSFSMFTLCLISLVENVSSLLPHLLRVQRLRIRVIGLAPTLNPDGLYK